jgi:hypothetical protein
MPSEPGASRETTIMTPPAEQPGALQSDFASDMNMIVGGALAPIPDVAPQRLVAPKAGPGLRLPSFEAMGIASPHPDSVRLPGVDSVREHVLGLALRSRSDPGRVNDSVFRTPDIGGESGLHRMLPPMQGSHPQQTPLHRFPHTLTPPAEKGEPTWRPSIATAVMDSRDPEAGVAASKEESSDESIRAASGAMQSVTITAPAITGDRSWLEEAVQAIRQSHFKLHPETPTNSLNSL